MPKPEELKTKSLIESANGFTLEQLKAQGGSEIVEDSEIEAFNKKQDPLPKDSYTLDELQAEGITPFAIKPLTEFGKAYKYGSQITPLIAKKREIDNQIDRYQNVNDDEKQYLKWAAYTFDSEDYIQTAKVMQGLDPKQQEDNVFSRFIEGAVTGAAVAGTGAGLAAGTLGPAGIGLVAGAGALFEGIRSAATDQKRYYFDEQGRAVALGIGELPPPGAKIESIFGNQLDAGDDNMASTLAKSVYNGFITIGKAVPETANLLYGLTTGQDASWMKDLSAHVETLKFDTRPEANESVFSVKEDGGVEFTPNPHNMLRLMGEVVGSLAQFIGGAGAVGAITGSTAKTAAATEMAELTGAPLSIGQKLAKNAPWNNKEAWMVASMISLSEASDAARQAGITGRAGYAFTAVTAMGVGAAEILIGGQELRLLNKRKIFKDVAEDLGENSSVNSMFNATINNTLKNIGLYGKNAVKEAAGEGLEESTQTLFSQYMQVMYDNLAHDGNKYGTVMMGDKERAELYESALGGFMGGSFGAVISPQRERSQNEEIFRHVTTGTEGSLITQLAIARGQNSITQEQADNALEKIDLYKQYNDQIKDKKVEDDDKRKLFDAIWQKGQAEQKFSAIPEDSKNPIEAAEKKKYEKDVKSWQTEIEKIVANFDKPKEEKKKKEEGAEELVQSEVNQRDNTVVRDNQEQHTAGYSAIALDYLFTGGRDVIQSTDYLLQALVGGFEHSAKKIDEIRNKYADKLGNIKDDINSNVYNSMMQEIKDVISKKYNNSKAIEIFDKILNNATGFTTREGIQISNELDNLNAEVTATETDLPNIDDLEVRSVSPVTKTEESKKSKAEELTEKITSKKAVRKEELVRAKNLQEIKVAEAENTRKKVLEGIKRHAEKRQQEGTPISSEDYEAEMKRVSDIQQKKVQDEKDILDQINAELNDEKPAPKPTKEDDINDRKKLARDTAEVKIAKLKKDYDEGVISVFAHDEELEKIQKERDSKIEEIEKETDDTEVTHMTKQHRAARLFDPKKHKTSLSQVSKKLNTKEKILKFFGIDKTAKPDPSLNLEIPSKETVKKAPLKIVNGMLEIPGGEVKVTDKDGNTTSTVAHSKSLPVYKLTDKHGNNYLFATSDIVDSQGEFVPERTKKPVQKKLGLSYLYLLNNKGEVTNSKVFYNQRHEQKSGAFISDDLAYFKNQLGLKLEKGREKNQQTKETGAPVTGESDFSHMPKNEPEKTEVPEEPFKITPDTEFKAEKLSEEEQNDPFLNKINAERKKASDSRAKNIKKTRGDFGFFYNPEAVIKIVGLATWKALLDLTYNLYLKGLRILKSKNIEITEERRLELADNAIDRVIIEAKKLHREETGKEFTIGEEADLTISLKALYGSKTDIRNPIVAEYVNNDPVLQARWSDEIEAAKMMNLSDSEDRFAENEKKLYGLFINSNTHLPYVGEYTRNELMEMAEDLVDQMPDDEVDVKQYFIDFFPVREMAEIWRNGDQDDFHFNRFVRLRNHYKSSQRFVNLLYINSNDGPFVPLQSNARYTKPQIKRENRESLAKKLASISITEVRSILQKNDEKKVKILIALDKFIREENKDLIELLKKESGASAKAHFNWQYVISKLNKKSDVTGIDWAAKKEDLIDALTRSSFVADLINADIETAKRITGIDQHKNRGQWEAFLRYYSKKEGFETYERFLANRIINGQSFGGKTAFPTADNATEISFHQLSRIRTLTSTKAIKDYYEGVGEKGSQLDTISRHFAEYSVNLGVAKRFTTATGKNQDSTEYDSFLTSQGKRAKREDIRKLYKDNPWFQKFKDSIKFFKLDGVKNTDTNIAEERSKLNSTDFDIMLIANFMHSDKEHMAGKGNYLFTMDQQADSSTKIMIPVERLRNLTKAQKDSIRKLHAKRNKTTAKQSSEAINEEVGKWQKKIENFVAKKFMTDPGVSSREFAEEFVYNHIYNKYHTDQYFRGKNDRELSYAMSIKRKIHGMGLTLLQGLPGGIGKTHRVMIVNDPKVFIDIGAWNKEVELPDGGDIMMPWFNDQIEISSGGMYSGVIKAFTYTHINGSEHLIKANDVVYPHLHTEEGKIFYAQNPMAKKIVEYAKEHGIDRIAFKSGTKITGEENVNDWKWTTSGPDIKEVDFGKEAPKYIDIENDDFRVMLDLTNEGLLNLGSLPTQILNILKSTKHKAAIDKLFSEASLIKEKEIQEILDKGGEEIIKWLMTINPKSDDVMTLKEMNKRSAITMQDPIVRGIVNKYWKNAVRKKLLDFVVPKAQYVHGKVIGQNLGHIKLDKEKNEVQSPVVYLPASAMKSDENPNGFEEGEGLFIIRVPTGDLNSFSYVKVAGFLPPTMKNTIVTDSAIQVYSGSDHDGDTVFLWAPYKNKAGKEVPAGDSSYESRMNSIFEMMKETYEDPHMFNRITEQTTIAKKKEYLEKHYDEGKNLDPLMPSSWNKMVRANLDSQDVISITASALKVVYNLASNDINLSTQIRFPKFNTESRTWEKIPFLLTGWGRTVDKDTIKSFEFKGKNYYVEIEKNQEDESEYFYYNEDNKLVKDEALVRQLGRAHTEEKNRLESREKEKLFSVLNAHLNHAADAVKNGTLSMMNKFSSTAGQYDAFLGLDAEIEDSLTAFMHTPGMKKFIELYEHFTSVSNRRNGDDVYDKIVLAMISPKTMGESLTEEQKEFYGNTWVLQKNRLPDLNDYDMESDSITSQIKIVRMFSAMNKLSSEIQMINKILKLTTSGPLSYGEYMEGKHAYDRIMFPKEGSRPLRFINHSQVQEMINSDSFVRAKINRAISGSYYATHPISTNFGQHVIYKIAKELSLIDNPYNEEGWAERIRNLKKEQYDLIYNEFDKFLMLQAMNVTESKESLKDDVAQWLEKFPEDSFVKKYLTFSLVNERVELSEEAKQNVDDFGYSKIAKDKMKELSDSDLNMLTKYLVSEFGWKSAPWSGSFYEILPYKTLKDVKTKLEGLSFLNSTNGATSISRDILINNPELIPEFDTLYAGVVINGKDIPSSGKYVVKNKAGENINELPYFVKVKDENRKGKYNIYERKKETIQYKWNSVDIFYYEKDKPVNLSNEVMRASPFLNRPASNSTMKKSIKPTVDLSKQWKGDLDTRPVYSPEGINTMRTRSAKPNEHFGNPFSEAGYGGTRKVPSIGAAVKAYKDWLLTGYAEWLDENGEVEDFAGNVEQRKWILNQINQGKLDGATLLYAGKLEARGQGMHPTALAEVVEELRENATSQSIEQNPQYEGKPEFNKLPGKSSTPTMTYAGIGSRKTPDAILKKMTEVAKKLETLGYTLRSGGAMGADKAFESGVKEKKEVFPGGKKAGKREHKIAREIHPNPQAIDRISSPGGSEFTWNLQARNTNQIFGENLDIPVDFVLAWTPDVLTDYKKRTIKSGGTGQAIDMASRKGIPVINMADPNWEAQLNAILNLPPPPPTGQSQIDFPEDTTGPKNLNEDPITPADPKQIEIMRKKFAKLFPHVKAFSAEEFQRIIDVVAPGKKLDMNAWGASIGDAYWINPNTPHQEAIFHEHAHIYWAMLPENDMVKQKLLKFYGSEEAAVNAIGKAGTELVRIESENKGLFNKISNWMKHFWSRVRAMIWKDASPDLYAKIMAQRMWKGTDAELAQQDFRNLTLNYMKRTNTGPVFQDHQEKIDDLIKKINEKRENKIKSLSEIEHTDITRNAFSEIIRRGAQNFWQAAIERITGKQIQLADSKEFEIMAAGFTPIPGNNDYVYNEQFARVPYPGAMEPGFQMIRPVDKDTFSKDRVGIRYIDLIQNDENANLAKKVTKEYQEYLSDMIESAKLLSNRYTDESKLELLDKDAAVDIANDLSRLKAKYNSRGMNMKSDSLAYFDTVDTIITSYATAHLFTEEIKNEVVSKNDKNRVFIKALHEIFDPRDVKDLTTHNSWVGKDNVIAPFAAHLKSGSAAVALRNQIIQRAEYEANNAQAEIKHLLSPIYKKLKDLKVTKKEMTDMDTNKSVFYFVHPSGPGYPASENYQKLKGKTDEKSKAIIEFADTYASLLNSYAPKEVIATGEKMFQVNYAEATGTELSKKLGWFTAFMHQFFGQSKYDRLHIMVPEFDEPVTLKNYKRTLRGRQKIGGADKKSKRQYYLALRKATETARKMYDSTSPMDAANEPIIRTDAKSMFHSLYKEDSGTRSRDILTPAMHFLHQGAFVRALGDNLLVMEFTENYATTYNAKGKNVARFIKQLNDWQLYGIKPESKLPHNVEIVTKFLIEYTGLKFMALNFGAATMNLFGGITQNVRDLGFRKTGLGVMRTFGSVKPGTNWKTAFLNSKIVNIMQQQRILEINHDWTTADSSDNYGFIKQLLFSPTAFVEFFNHSMTIAGSMSQKQWDAYKHDGTVKDGHKGMTADQIIKLISEAQDIHGSYHRLAKRIAASTTEGRAIMQLRTWMFDIYDVHAMSERFAGTSDKKLKGIIRTVGDIGGGTFKYLEVLAKEKDHEKAKKMFYAMKPVDQENLRKLAREATMMLLISMLIAGFGDDDKETYTSLNRMWGDVAVVYDIDNYIYTFQGGLPVFSTIVDALKMMKGLAENGFYGPLVYEKDTKYGKKGDSKVPMMVVNTLPMEKVIKKFMEEK